MKIGVFGGTFNPIHSGHMALAKYVRRYLMLDRVYFIPSNIPPHKDTCHVESEHRLRMTHIAADILGEGYYVSDFEVASEEVSYSYKTLKKFRDDFKDSSLFFLCGTDIFATIETWQNWQKLFELANFVVVSRSDISFDDMIRKIPAKLVMNTIEMDQYSGAKNGQVILCRMPEIDMSSTMIRNEFGSVAEQENALPEEIYEYILKHRLYGSVDEGSGNSKTSA